MGELEISCIVGSHFPKIFRKEKYIRNVVRHSYETDVVFILFIKTFSLFLQFWSFSIFSYFLDF